MNWSEFKNRWLKWVIVLVLFLVGLFCFMKEYGYAESVPLDQEFYYQVYTGKNKGVIRNERAEWQEAYDNHHFNAVRTYTDAYNRVWWLPNLTWRQIGRDAWVAACATAGTSTPTSALVVAFAAMLSQYGCHCLDEWDYIQEKLSWSEYHFGRCAYYASLLHK
jgi:hypothetical protein